MKSLKILYLLLIALNVVSDDSHAQILHNKNLNEVIDSIQIFPAIGVIRCPSGADFVPNDSLNELFIEKLSTTLPKTTGIRATWLQPEHDLSDSLKEYFVQTIPKFSEMNQDVFSRIPLGESFNKMIADVPGRYFGIIFYDGRSSENVPNQLMKSAGVSIAVAALTGGLFSMFIIPQGPNILNDFLLIDKQNNCFVYYHRRIQRGSPLKETNIVKNYTKIFEELK